MFKRTRKLEYDSPAARVKRRRSTQSNKSNSTLSENILWPEEDEAEESFFSNSNLGNLLDTKTPDSSQQREAQDDSLFASSKLEALLQNDFEPALFESENKVEENKRDYQARSSQKNETFFGNSTLDFLVDDKDEEVLSSKQPPTPSSEESFLSVSTVVQLIDNSLSAVEQDNKNSVISLPPIDEEHPSQHQLKLDETLFSDINLDELTSDEKEQLSEECEVVRELCVQNTQKFLDDVATFKIPAPKIAAQATQMKAMGKSILNSTIQGSQYALHDDLMAEVQQLNWETEVFPVAMEETFPSKGDFYGLPERVKKLIFEHKGIKNLYEWQDECLNLPAIHKRKNLIYALPTSGGKTLVAEILMLREVLCREKDVLFILPYVSIVQEKVCAMSPFGIALNFIVDEYTAGKGKCPPAKRAKRRGIFIASIEKAAVLIDSLIEAQRAEEIGLVVVDELHLIGEKGRGATLEALLTKMMFLETNIQIVGMSATIGNLAEVSAFLKADVYTRGFRPVELKEYIKCGNDILEINAEGKTLEEVFVYKRTVNFKYNASVARMDPDHLAGLVSECAPENCCLVFCPTRKNCENVALLLSRILPKKKFLEYRKSEKTDLMDALDKICGILSPVLAKTIPYGIAYHHSGLTTDERKFIETAYRFGVLSVICCTSTLAAGVNLPAKRVIIRAPYIGAEFMTLCRYKQMVGRAGRAGMGEAGESILIASSKDNVRIGEMLFSPMDKAISSLNHQECIGLQSLILSTIGLKLASCRTDLYKLVNGSLLAVQSKDLNISTEELILNILREMFKHNVLELCAPNQKRNLSGILTTQDTATNTQLKKCIYVCKTTRFQLTTIGRAAFKAGIDYKRTYSVYNELKFAQKHLILTNYAHLLYLVVCFNSSPKGDDLFGADASILFREYTTLDETSQGLFKLLGFTEAHAAKMAKTLSIQGAMELQLNRLFKVLILVDILNVQPLPAVAEKFNIERGLLQNLISQSTSAASAIVRLCEQLEEFWCFKSLFERVSAKMDRCGTMELEPLLELPAVKINRAKQLYAAGYKTIEDIAKCRPIDLVRGVEHMPMRVAKEIISAAKIILMKKLDYLEEETTALKMCLEQSNYLAN